MHAAYHLSFISLFGLFLFVCIYLKSQQMFILSFGSPAPMGHFYCYFPNHFLAKVSSPFWVICPSPRFLSLGSLVYTTPLHWWICRFEMVIVNSVLFCLGGHVWQQKISACTLRCLSIYSLGGVSMLISTSQTFQRRSWCLCFEPYEAQ